MKFWVEKENALEGSYKLFCPMCGFCYSPKSNQDGTISPTEILGLCPKCGEKLSDPCPDKRW